MMMEMKELPLRSPCQEAKKEKQISDDHDQSNEL
jgi:hypothetical protein